MISFRLDILCDALRDLYTFIQPNSHTSEFVSKHPIIIISFTYASVATVGVVITELFARLTLSATLMNLFLLCWSTFPALLCLYLRWSSSLVTTDLTGVFYFSQILMQSSSIQNYLIVSTYDTFYAHHTHSKIYINSWAYGMKYHFHQKIIDYNKYIYKYNGYQNVRHWSWIANNNLTLMICIILSHTKPHTHVCCVS